MFFDVWSAKGRVLYIGGSWPMARAALDQALMADEGCPQLVIRPEPEPDSEL